MESTKYGSLTLHGGGQFSALHVDELSYPHCNTSAILTLIFSDEDTEARKGSRMF